MTYFNENDFLAIGKELEISVRDDSPFYGRSHSDIQRALHSDGFNWIESKREYRVKCELIIPPFSYKSEDAISDLSDLFTWLLQNRFRVGLSDNGGHLNVGLKSIVNVTPDQHWLESKSNAISHIANTGRSGVFTGFNNTEEMPLLLSKDVTTRYATHKNQINAFLPRSRHNHDHVNPIDHVAINGRSYNRFMDADVNECDNIIGGKFRYINFGHYTSGRLEFRQFQATLSTRKLSKYCEFIETLFRHSDSTRIDYNSLNDTNLDSPTSLYRNGSRIGVMYSLARVDGGVSTQSLMNATGWDASTIRARFSEIRNHPDIDSRLVVQHDQQTNGHRYGSSDGRYDQNSYEILRSLQLIGSLSLYGANRIGNDSVWGSMSDDCFEYLQQLRPNS